MTEKKYGKAAVIPFSDAELERRVNCVRSKMVEMELDAVLFRSSESVYYLTGMNHYGFFAEHILLVPREGKMRLIVRETETVTFNTKGCDRNTLFCPFQDYENSYDRVVQEVKNMKLENARWGIEKAFMSATPFRVMEAIIENLPGVKWTDFSEEIMYIRIQQSEEELSYTREAGRISTEMMKTVEKNFRIGAYENEIAGEVLSVMAKEGGEYPGFPPFVHTIKPGHGWCEHVAWQNNTVKMGDNFLAEVSACVNHYHAPIGRLMYTGKISDFTRKMCEVNKEAFNVIIENLKEGVSFGEVWDKWREFMLSQNLPGDYYRRHCGYITGLSFPPSWCGGGSVISLQHTSKLIVRKGMVFHVLPAMFENGRLDALMSSAAVAGETKGEALTDYTFEPVTCCE